MTAPTVTLRVNFSHEDKAAKGLRSLKEPAQAPAPAVYFTANEMADMAPRLLLIGERGSGKTVFARARALKTEVQLVEISDGILPAIMRDGRPLVVDGIDRLGPGEFDKLTLLLAQMPERGVLLLGETTELRGRALPEGFVVHALLPLQEVDRREALAAVGLVRTEALTPAAGNPAIFAMALETGNLTAPFSIEALVDAFCVQRPTADADGYQAVATGRSTNRRVDDLLAAHYLAGRSSSDATALFAADPRRWLPVLEHTLRRRPEWCSDLLVPLAGGNEDNSLRGALLLASAPGASAIQEALQDRLLAIVSQGRLTVFDRDAAARKLAIWGDPRDLLALCSVPGGRFTMGSATHPNSTPVHEAAVDAFRIGRYPVTNAAYASFVNETGRRWVSPERGLDDRSNAPATDLTWHDAMAYCRWLTGRWRTEGRISSSEIVRLPTEPEWERASRGDWPDPEPGSILYPWGVGWLRDAANSDESGFNAPCAVGLFPEGASPYGCLDMAGEVWEWTTTLWGDDMTTPSFRYPYAADGREDLGAGPSIRRVLRGGCFSSGRLKANCTYRGSLEPDGFWRGNGFRIVIAEEDDRQPPRHRE